MVTEPNLQHNVLLCKFFTKTFLDISLLELLTHINALKLPYRIWHIIYKHLYREVATNLLHTICRNVEQTKHLLGHHVKR
jgi:hypothetical protein